MKRLALFAAAALLAAPAAAQVKPGPDAQTPEDAEMLDMLRGAVTSMRENMFAPGPAVEGWDRGGGDPDSALRAAGADGHYLLHSGSHGAALVMLTQRPISAFAPEGWRIADSYGSAEAVVANPFVQFTQLSARYVVASRSNSRRVGTADCGDPVAHAILYELPDAAETEADEDIPMLFRIFLLAAEDQVVCTRYEADGAAWRPRSFLPTGRSLPQLDDAGDRVRVVPAAPIGTLLQPPGPRATS